MRTPVKELIRSEENQIKRMTSLIDEIGFHLGVLFAEDKLEMERFELSEGQTGWIYAINLKDNDVDFSGVVPYGTCVEKMVLNIYEDVWNNEITPESENPQRTNPLEWEPHIPTDFDCCCYPQDQVKWCKRKLDSLYDNPNKSDVEDLKSKIEFVEDLFGIKDLERLAFEIPTDFMECLCYEQQIRWCRMKIEDLLHRC